jgi:hypothetical protein
VELLETLIIVRGWCHFVALRKGSGPVHQAVGAACTYIRLQRLMGEGEMLVGCVNHTAALSCCSGAGIAQLKIGAEENSADQRSAD